MLHKSSSHAQLMSTRVPMNKACQWLCNINIRSLVILPFALASIMMLL